MKKTIHIMMLIAALTIAWGCSSDSSDGDTYNLNYSVTTTTARPDWAIDWYNNEPAPNWEEPNQNLFEHSMYLILTLPQNLVPFSTDDDLMAVFINNECRSVAKASPLEDGSKVYFVNTVRGNDTDKEVYLSSMVPISMCPTSSWALTRILYPTSWQAAPSTPAR